MPTVSESGVFVLMLISPLYVKLHLNSPSHTASSSQSLKSHSVLLTSEPYLLVPAVVQRWVSQLPSSSTNDTVGSGHLWCAWMPCPHHSNFWQDKMGPCSWHPGESKRCTGWETLGYHIALFRESKKCQTHWNGVLCPCALALYIFNSYSFCELPLYIIKHISAWKLPTFYTVCINT